MPQYGEHGCPKIRSRSYQPSYCTIAAKCFDKTPPYKGSLEIAARDSGWDRGHTFAVVQLPTSNRSFVYASLNLRDCFHRYLMGWNKPSMSIPLRQCEKDHVAKLSLQRVCMCDASSEWFQRHPDGRVIIILTSPASLLLAALFASKLACSPRFAFFTSITRTIPPSPLQAGFQSTTH